jgi:hypothetical protein
VTFIVGGVLVAGGAALFFTAPHGKKSSKPAAHLTPSFGSRSAGLSFGTSW